MPTIFYIILVVSLPHLYWHWGWFALSVVMSLLCCGEGGKACCEKWSSMCKKAEKKEPEEKK